MTSSIIEYVICAAAVLLVGIVLWLIAVKIFGE